MNPTTTTTRDLRHGFYRYGRQTYNLPASVAMAYARDRFLIWRDDLRWTVEPDESADDGYGSALVVLLIDDNDIIVDALGGIDVPFSVSDHGNTHTDEHSPFLVSIVADMIRTYRETTKGDGILK